MSEIMRIYGTETFQGRRRNSTTVKQSIILQEDAKINYMIE